jgi:hypothetical protein
LGQLPDYTWPAFIGQIIGVLLIAGVACGVWLLLLSALVRFLL